MLLLHSRPPHNFAGVYEHNWQRARVAVLPVPYDGTASWKSGARNGPAAIIEASRNMEWFDEELGCEIAQKVGVYTLEELEPDARGPEHTIARVEKAVCEMAEEGKFPVVLGGEHSITIGAVRALAAEDGDFSVLQLDAHADLREEYEGSRFNHACVMRRVREEVRGAIAQAGVRSLSKEESGLIEKEGLKVHFWHEEGLPAKKIASELGERVYITIDVDVLNPAEMPSTGTPEPGGPGYEEVVALLREVARKKEVIGFDLVELAPIPCFHAPDFLAARLAYKLIGYAFAKRLGLW